MNSMFTVMRKNSTTAGTNYGAADVKIRAILKSLYTNSANGGNHSAGVAVVNSKPSYASMYVKPGNIKVFKSLDDPEIFVKGPGYVNLLNEMSCNTTAFLGKVTNHGRRKAATRDTQPFVHGDVVGVVSGFVKNAHTLAKKHGIALKSSDSTEIIVALINKSVKEDKLSLKMAVKKMSFEVEGSYAGTVSSTAEYGLVIAFRKDRPLYTRYRKIGGVLFISDSLELIYKAYEAAQWDESNSKLFVDMSELIVPERTGLLLDPNTLSYDNGWVEKNVGFLLCRNEPNQTVSG